MLAAAFVVVVGVVLVRTAMFTPEVTPLPPPAEFAVDKMAAAERLAGAVRIRTVTRNEEPPFDPETFDALHRYLRERYPLAHTKLSTETVAQHSLLFKWAGRDPKKSPMLLMAHQDVVPVEEQALSGWTQPPFAGVIADGFIWGRGTLDNKQGVIGILEAVEGLLEAGFEPERTVYLAFGHDEETGGTGAVATAKLLEQRGVKLAFVVDEGGLLTRGIVPDVEDWVALIGVAEKGYVSLALSTVGEGGHSSMPPRQTAVGVLAQAIATLEANPFPAKTEVSMQFFSRVAPKMPFLQRMVFANLWLFEPLLIQILSGQPSTSATLRTTTAATIFKGGVKDNLLPKRAEAVVNFRIIPGETPETVKAQVEKIVADDRVTVDFYAGDGDGIASSPSRFSSPDGEGFVALSETIRQVAQDPGLVVAPYLMVGATDSRHYEDVTEQTYRFVFNRFGPPDLNRIHGTDERITVDNFAETIQFYALFIQRAAGR